MAVLAVLLVVIGILPWTAPAPSEVRASAVAALIAGVLAALIAWGLARSVALERRQASEAQLDAVLHAAGGGCDCGHDHGPAGEHPAAEAEACASPGGTECTHSCATCVLAGQRGPGQ
jgi:hypothetical protein